MSVNDALRRYSERELRKHSPRRKNGNPEALVVNAILAWLKLNGFSCHKVESKAVYSARAGRYLRGQTNVGVSDIIGVAPNGVAVFVEVKAPGRRANLSPAQVVFLTDKINHGAFALASDSVEHLESLWNEFKKIRSINLEKARDYLIADLPADKLNRIDTKVG